ncbi:MAG: nitroreductase family protein [Mariprofundaceae bacterium]|nr:nitroreductase family protein [Mariprofundaceae bacterium]
MSKVRTETIAEVHELIGNRWSPRAYDVSRPVEREKLLSILEAARWAPSCFGDEPWRYVVCDRSADETAWQSMLACLAEKNRLWASHAPLLLLACSDAQFRQNGNPNRWGQYDTGAASISLCLQATALGLASHQMGGFDVEDARKAFAVPEQYMPMAVIAIGYAGSIDDLDEGFAAVEKGERKRQPLSGNFFSGRWGEGLFAESREGA